MRRCYINKRKVKAILKELDVEGDEFVGMLERYKGKYMFMTKEPYVVLVQGDDYRSAPNSCLKFIGKRT
jgi:hypothetical protein